MCIVTLLVIHSPTVRHQIFLGGRESGRSTEQSASEAASDMESLAAFSSDPLKVTIQLAPDEGR